VASGVSSISVVIEIRQGFARGLRAKGKRIFFIEDLSEITLRGEVLGVVWEVCLTQFLRGEEWDSTTS
jgi:hypothetical protein